MDSKGSPINLKKISAKYEDAAFDANDQETTDKMFGMQDIVDSLSKLGLNGIENEVTKLENEDSALLSKAKLKDIDIYKRNVLSDDILKDITKDGDYYNRLTIAKANLLATQTLLSSKDKPKTASEELEGLPDSLVKESEADLKKEAADLKKSESVVGVKEDKKEKKGLFSKFKKDKNKEEDTKGEKKESNLLSKISGGAENALFSVAGKATESLGAASPLAKKGLGALKGAIDKKGGLGDAFSKKAESKTELEKKSAVTPSMSPNANPALVSDVKKLTPVAKKEAAKSQEAPKEIKSAESKATPSSPAPTADAKKDSDKKSESQGTDKSGLGSDKDIQDIKNALVRIAGLLEGPLTVSALDQPFRPDSRRI
jgi:hypothetical protein